VEGEKKVEEMSLEEIERKIFEILLIAEILEKQGKRKMTEEERKELEHLKKKFWKLGEAIGD